IRIMKLTVGLLLMTMITATAVNTYSQNARISLNVKDATILDIFREIERNSEFGFFYKSEEMNLEKRQSIEVSAATIDDILKKVLDENYTYKILDKNIVVTKGNLEGSQQQTRKVSGKVTDSSGATLPGVSVVVRGTTLGVITDIDGNYTISNLPENAILEFSFVGMKSQELAVAGKITINVSLKEDAIGIEEVVAVGYGTQRKITMAGAIASVENKNIINIPVANTANTLAGKLPGLIVVQRGGQPGFDKSDFSIRGFGNAITIVDGVEQSFDQIDPSEIESFSVLKDASASIYGARAGNGVILVTTKRGKAEKSKINFSANYGFQSPTRFPELADAVLYATLRNEAYLNANPGDVNNQPFTAEAISKYKSGADPNYPNTNWYNEAFKKQSPIAQFNLNSSGGTDKIKYFMSLGYMDQGGLAKSNAFEFKRYNVRSNIDAVIAENFNISLDLSARIEDARSPSGRLMDLMEKVFTAKPTSPASFPDPAYVSYGGGGNPVAMSDPSISGKNNNYNKVFNGILTARYTVPSIKGLSANARFSYLTNDQTNKYWKTGYAGYNYDYAAKVYSQVFAAGKNTLTQEFYRNNNFTSQISMNYENKFGKSAVKGLLLAEYISINSNNIRAYREGFLSSAIDQLYAGSLDGMSNNGSAYEDGRISYVGRVNYDFSQKYLLEATFRYDASARFLPEKRWGLFPGFLAGWRISEEEFMKSAIFVDNLKLRYSYGEAGNDNTSQYNFLTGYVYGGQYALGETAAMYQGIISKGLPNPNITWENTSTHNFGVDASFWKGKLSIEIDLFKRKVSGVMGSRIASLPSTFGATLPAENINSYNNRGFELRLGHKNRISDFNYSVEGNVSWSRGKWDHFEEPVFVDDASRERLQWSGQWMNRFFGYEALGFFNSQAEIDSWPVNQDLNAVKNKTIKPGDIKYLDYNKDGKLDDKDKHVIGRGFTPEVMFGLNFTASYKGFDMSMLWQGATNFNTYFDKEAQVSFYNGENILASFENHWTPTNLNAKYPRLTYGSVANNVQTSTFWLQDASYLRLKNIQIGYTIPKRFSGIANIDNIRIFLSGYNLITLDNVTPFDPEANGSAWYYPQQKSLSAGVSLTF
ncbi:MAG: TonB-dependent receptor, partial [Prolixibacteraceae bacterium]